MKTYNVWVCVEEIENDNGEDGKDIAVFKLAKYKNEDEAIEFAHQLERYEDTPRDDEGFTIK
jgi:hypothetical protein